MPSNTPTPAPGAQLSPRDRLEEIDTVLYHWENLFRVITGLGSAFPCDARTDGIDPEPFQVLFDWIADELHETRDSLGELHKEMK